VPESRKSRGRGGQAAGSGGAALRGLSDPYELERFVDAQDQPGTSGRVFDRALDELCAGEKRSHWMWFVFPQVEGLGASVTSRRFAIGSLGEARAYLDHPVLGPRLVEATAALNDLQGDDAVNVLGVTDAIKLRSSLTLFSQVASGGEPFEAALEKYFGGSPDQMTLEILESKGR